MKYKVYYEGFYIVEADSLEDALAETTRDDAEVEYEEWENTAAEDWGGANNGE